MIKRTDSFSDLPSLQQAVAAKTAGVWSLGGHLVINAAVEVSTASCVFREFENVRLCGWLPLPSCSSLDDAVVLHGTRPAAERPATRCDYPGPTAGKDLVASGAPELHPKRKCW